MRLGYPGYEGRLQSMRSLKPARYRAVMAGARTFLDPDWQCGKCSGSERHTRNLTCRACNGARVATVFKTLPDGLTVYVPKDEQASENWQARHQQAIWLEDQRATLSRLGAITVDGYSLEGGRVTRAGAAVLDTGPLMHAVDALLSGDSDQIRAVLTPLLNDSRELVLLVRGIAHALNNPQNPRK